MRRLTIFDIEELKLGAGHGQGPVTLPREVFDTLVAGYAPHEEDGRASRALGYPYKLSAEVRRLSAERA